MEEKLYSIEEVATILRVHHKTIRRYITSGQLRASKVGKQWRVSGHDLSQFVEGSEIEVKGNSNEQSIEFTANENNNLISGDINVSTVVDIKNLKEVEYDRISNSLLAVMNSTDVRVSKATINMKYTKENGNLKIMLWGTLEFTKELLDLISIFTDNRGEEND